MVGTSELLPPEGAPILWLVVKAEPGEVNALTVTATAGGALVVRDGTAAVGAEGGDCAQVSAHQVTCSPRGAPFGRVVVESGDRDDAAHVGVAVPAELSGGAGDDRLGYTGPFGALVKGDAGDDLLAGGSGGDQLLGGAGADVMRGAGGPDQLHMDGELPDHDLADGGAGDDDVIYDLRRNVVVDLAAGLAGGAGERDRLTATEGVVTAGGDDVVTGTARADRIATGAGEDRIRSGAGDDHVNSGPGRDRVAAGSGSDVVNPGHAPVGLPAGLPLQPGDVLRCGSGTDRVAEVALDDLLGRDCEALAELGPFAGTIPARPVRITRRSLAFRVPCRRTRDERCTGRLLLADRRGAALGRRAFRVRPGRRADVRVTLTRRGRRLLHGRRPVTVRVGLRYDQGGFPPSAYDVGWSIKLRTP